MAEGRGRWQHNAMAEGLEKILIIRLGSLGDVILTTPVLSFLHARFPDAMIDFAVKKEYADLFSSDPRIRSLRIFDSRGAHRGISGLLAFISTLRDISYDLVIDLHSNLRSFVIRKRLKGVRKIIYRKDVLRRRLLVWGLLNKGAEFKHTVQKYLDALKPLGLNEGVAPPNIFLSPDNIQWAQQYLAGIGDGKAILGIAPMAAWFTKKWFGERFRAVAERVRDELSARVIYFGSAEERGSIEVLAGKSAPIVTGDVGIRNLAALLARCSLLLTNDSGLMHLATAVGTPVVAIFGPTTRELGFFPLGSNDVVVEKEVSCRPCTLHGDEVCPNGHFKCMDFISVSEVYNIVVKKLSG